MARCALTYDAQRSAIDTSMTLKKIGTHDIQLACEKRKDAPEFKKLQFAFVTMGGADETPVLQIVPRSQAPTGPKLGKNEQLTIDTYFEETEGLSAHNSSPSTRMAPVLSQATYRRKAQIKK